MKPRSPLIMFLPWIVFSCLPNNQFVTGASIALVLSVVLSWRLLLRGNVMELGGSLFFLAMMVIGLCYPHGNDITRHPNLWCNAMMTCLMLGSVVINKPFTAQYTEHGTMAFHRLLSAVWGGLLCLATLISVLHLLFGLNMTLSTVGTILAIYLGIKANAHLPRWYFSQHGV